MELNCRRVLATDAAAKAAHLVLEPGAPQNGPQQLPILRQIAGAVLLAVQLTRGEAMVDVDIGDAVDVGFTGRDLPR